MNRAKAFTLAAAALWATEGMSQDASDADIASYISENQRSLALLEEGAFQSSLSFSVGMSGNDYGIGSVGATQVTSSVGLSYGLSRRTEIFAEMPFSWLRINQSIFDETSGETTRSGTAIVGIRRVLAFETDKRPEIVGTIAFSHPIGGELDELGLRLGLDGYRLLDPVLLNFGVGVGVGLETGSTQYEISGGVDFAISDRFGLGFDVSWVSDGQVFADPIRDGISFTASASIMSESGVSTITPYITMGATEGASDAVLGISWMRIW